MKKRKLLILLRIKRKNYTEPNLLIETLARTALLLRPVSTGSKSLNLHPGLLSLILVQSSIYSGKPRIQTSICLQKVIEYGHPPNKDTYTKATINVVRGSVQHQFVTAASRPIRK